MRHLPQKVEASFWRPVRDEVIRRVRLTRWVPGTQVHYSNLFESVEAALAAEGAYKDDDLLQIAVDVEYIGITKHGWVVPRRRGGGTYVERLLIRIDPSVWWEFPAPVGRGAKYARWGEKESPLVEERLTPDPKWHPEKPVKRRSR